MQGDHSVKMQSFMRFSFAVLALSSLPAWAYAKDVTLRQRTTVGGRAHETRQYWTDTKMVRDSPDFRLIADLKSRTVTVVDKSEKEYTTMTLDELHRQAQDRLQRQKAMKPALQKALGTDATLELKPTSKKQKILGYTAKEYAVEGSVINGSVWLTEEINLGKGAQELRQVVADMGGPGRPGGQLTQVLATTKGVLLRQSTRSLAGTDKIASTMQVLEVTHKAPPPEVLKVPDGYKKVDTLLQ